MNAPVNTAKPRGAEAEYFAALAAGRLMIQRCCDCGHAIFHARPFCPQCDSLSLSWEQASGLGTVHTLTTVRIKHDRPYNISLIELDEGVRMMGRVEGIAPDAVKIGMRVQASIIDQGGKPLVVFTLTEAA
ncbi:MAG: Zn-ribbon domain-containing OB-fold protein [Bradyrhizobium sp.]